MKKSTRYEMRDTRYENGSALILVVVLTSLLAIVGVMFVMVARVDRMATSAISENKTLDSAVEVVIARISQELALDVPRSDSNGVKLAEYYDYPGPADRWLASLEPHKDGGYKWRQISDVTGYIEKVIPGVKGSWDTQDIEIDSDAIIEDHEEIVLDDDGNIEELGGQLADADGDGVADSKWVELEGINSSKGKTIFAAVRVIDNGAMLNVNTAYKFDPNETDKDLIDGSSQMQINLLALAQRSASNKIEDLDDARFGYEPLPHNLDDYIRDVVWRYYQPAKGTKYTPFDISDELELRNRYLLNRSDIDSRIEEVWDSAFQALNYLRTPVDSSLSLGDWEEEVYFDDSEPNADSDYSYRHIGTTYNMDRIINPYGGRMVNVNRDGAGFIYSAIKLALTADPNFKDIDEIAAQTAVNLIDFRDGASEPNVTTLDVNGITYYGFERPCVYISELAHNFKPIEGGGPIKCDHERSYAVELYKPYPEDDYPDSNEWRLFIDNSAASPPGDVNVPIDWSDGADFHVIRWRNPSVDLTVDPDASYYNINNFCNRMFDVGSIISLQRRVDAGWISVDSKTVRDPVINGWLNRDGAPLSRQRDITLHKCIRRLWVEAGEAGSPTLGRKNDYEKGDSIYIQAHPENGPFTNVGEIGMVFREDVYRRNWDSTDTEADVRLDLADPNYQQIFNYLTVFDPTRDGINNDGDDWTNEDALNQTPEWKIPGRININTAPWYVIAQLPWVSDTLAQAIVAYRDKLETPVDYSDPNAGNTGRYDVIKNKIPSWVDQDDIREELGFASIGELAFVLSGGKDEYNEYSIDRLSKDGNDLEDFPDLTPNDDAADDFEERDVIFSRISNLVTVRSDVFSAYILVRIGADGPQKRVMAIFDRSNVYSGDGRVQIVALHPVADPR